jgi:hypothetical protein
MTEVIGFKAADADLKCRDHQFEVGQTYTIDGEPVHCARGFHFCQNPLDVLNYYPLVQDGGKLTRFMSVVASGTVLTDGDKSVSAAIHVKAELRLPEFIKSAVDTVIGLCKGAENKDTAASGNGSKLAASGNGSKLAASGDYSKLAASGNGSQLAASGDYSQLAASGNGSQLAASGNGSKLAASGYYSQLAASGNGSKLAASGYYSQLAASGYYSKLAASGYYSQLAASGDYSKLAASGNGSQLAASGNGSQLAASGNGSKLAASGDYSKLAIEGNNGVAMSAGRNSTVTGVDGAWVSLASYDDFGICTGIATGCIGKGRLKAGKVYRAENGKFVEVKP